MTRRRATTTASLGPRAAALAALARKSLGQLTPSEHVRGRERLARAAGPAAAGRLVAVARGRRRGGLRGAGARPAGAPPERERAAARLPASKGARWRRTGASRRRPTSTPALRFADGTVIALGARDQGAAGVRRRARGARGDRRWDRLGERRAEAARALARRRGSVRHQRPRDGVQRRLERGDRAARREARTRVDFGRRSGDRRPDRDARGPATDGGDAPVPRAAARDRRSRRRRRRERHDQPGRPSRRWRRLPYWRRRRRRPSWHPRRPRRSFRLPRRSEPRCASPRPARSWPSALASGDFAFIIEEAERDLPRALEASTSDDLAALADAARYRRQDDLARRALDAQRRRFQGSPRAADAAFFLGRLDEKEGAGLVHALALVRPVPRRGPERLVRRRGAGAQDGRGARSLRRRPGAHAWPTSTSAASRTAATPVPRRRCAIKLGDRARPPPSRSGGRARRSDCPAARPRPQRPRRNHRRR